MIVMKFGGSSLASAELIRNAMNIAKERLHRKPVVVVSALGKTTDALVAAGEAALQGRDEVERICVYHQEIATELGIQERKLEPIFQELKSLLQGISLIKELSPRTRDHLVSFGERLSSRIIAAYCNNSEMPAKHFDGFDAGISTNSVFTNAEVLDESYDAIKKNLGSLKKDYKYTPIITGFIANDKKGNMTTLGRGGGDLTASVIGHALQAEEVQVWKDVNGILTTDPQVVKEAFSLDSISFEEASELAYFGERVLHPRSIKPAMVAGIPVRVKNSHNPSHPGTVILRKGRRHEDLIRLITFKKNVTLIDISSTRMLGQYGFMGKVFQVFADQRISVDLVATSEVSISLSVEGRPNLEHLKEQLEKLATVNIFQGRAIIALIGNVQHSSEILRKVFQVLTEKKINVQMISHGASKVNTSFVVNDEECEDCVRDLHHAFFEGKSK